ncbi:hypothetical protein BDW74DRAFT_175929 [Aspergillus multicolor]|uniref:uncharacterized protein n=1 Tax=Aspergillus multicolor TaxID=41759 RepID=UPI003CCDAD2F
MAIMAATASNPTPTGSGANTSEYILWGRRRTVSFIGGLPSLGAVLLAPLCVGMAYASIWHFDGSFIDAFHTLLNEGPRMFVTSYLPNPKLSREGMTGYVGWLLFHAILFVVLPGKTVYGPPTPSGQRLKYTMNGLNSFIVTVLTMTALAFTGVLPLTAIADNRAGLFAAASAYGGFASAFAWAKGHLAPSSVEDRRFSGSLVHDILGGIELSPRLGETFDIKLWQIGHVGMNVWAVIDISLMAFQLRELGTFCNAMTLVVALHMVYIIDFFIYEEWYLTTIDIAHEHFGFFLGWGSAIWLPMVYTIQTQYLAVHPIEMPWPQFAMILIAGLAGYGLFRLSNEQKYRLRRTDTPSTKGIPKLGRVIESVYTTADGKPHKSSLLLSGWWGVVRHPNYVGDIIFSFCVSACTGFTHFLPWLYFTFLTTLLIHRAIRDEARCLAKHGSAWRQYCREVPWVLVPWVF